MRDYAKLRLALLGALTSFSFWNGCGQTVCRDCGGCWDSSLLVSPTSVDMSLDCAGPAVSVPVTLRNVGSCATIHVSGAHLEDLGTEFAVDFKPVELAPDEKTTVTIKFTPNGNLGGRTGALVLEHDDALTTIPVFADHGDFSVTPNPVDFGQASVGGYLDMELTAQNVGCATPPISTIYLDPYGSSAFTVASLTLPSDKSIPLTVGAGELLRVVLRFEPQTCGTHKTALIIADPEAGAPYWAYEVTGVATDCASE